MAEEQRHLVHCNYPDRPVGSPGCICLTQREKTSAYAIRHNIEAFPTLLLEPVAVDKIRIIHQVARLHLCCTMSQAAAIREAIRPLPSDDEELLFRASEYLCVDWSQCQDRAELALKELGRRLEESNGSRWIHRQIMALTRELDEHPEWWDGPCCCDSCVADCQ